MKLDVAVDCATVCGDVGAATSENAVKRGIVHGKRDSADRRSCVDFSNSKAEVLELQRHSEANLSEDDFMRSEKQMRALQVKSEDARVRVAGLVEIASVPHE